MSEKQVKDKKNIPEDIRNGKFILWLFVAGNSGNSANAIINTKAFCEKYLVHNYQLEIIDIKEKPYLAFTEEIIAIPILIKKFPLPEERMIGDLSDIETVLKVFHIV